MPESAGVDKELAALRKEVYEARSLVIKTDNLLKTFHAELKTIATRQDAAESRHFVGHVASYVVIGLLAVGAAWWVARVAASTQRARATLSVAAAKKAKAAAKKAERQATAGLARRDRASRQALEAYALLTSKDPDKRARGLARYAAIPPAGLAPFARTVLGDLSLSVRRDLAQAAYDTGMRAYHQDDMKTAARSLGRFYTLAGPLPPSWQDEERRRGAYYLGTAASRSKDPATAVKWLRQYVAEGGARGTRAYADLVLGDALVSLKHSGEAKAAYAAGLQLEATGKVASLLRSRLKRLGVTPPPPPAGATATAEKATGSAKASTADGSKGAAKATGPKKSAAKAPKPAAGTGG